MHQGFGDAGEAQRLCWESSFSGHRKVGHGAGRRGKLALAWRHSSALSPQVSGAREPSAFHAPRLPPPHSWLLPSCGIGFRSDPGWDREVVPWNPCDGHPNCLTEVGCAGWLMRPRNPIFITSFLGIISSEGKRFQSGGLWTLPARH